eukprot:4836343-Pyramimonas_sp.AAC.1
MCPHPQCLELGLAGTAAHGFYASPNLLEQPTAAGLPEFDGEFEETRNALSERAVNSFGHECWTSWSCPPGCPAGPCLRRLSLEACLFLSGAIGPRTLR